MGEQRRTIRPPYLPYRTFRGYIEGLRATGVPAKIDRSVLRNRSGLDQTMLINSLLFLGMITADGTPTPALMSLVDSDAEQGQKVLHDILVIQFPFLFTGGFRLQTATPSMLQDAFANAGVSGDTVRKAVAFFLQAAEDAKIPISPHLKIRPGRLRGVRKRAKGAEAANGETPRVGQSTAPSIRKSLLNMLMEDIFQPERMDKTEQEAVWTLAKYLRKNETPGG